MGSTTANAPVRERTFEKPYLLTQEDFATIASILYEDAGIHLPESKAALAYSRLAKRLRVLGMTSFKEYCSYVRGIDGACERLVMLAALTTNVTRFFRENHHFDHLRTQVLPPLLEEARQGGRVRLWSAGCSNGAEPYSIAITVLSLMHDAGNYDIRILATDIDPNMIEQGREGHYPTQAVEGVPAPVLKRWFERDEGSVSPRQSVRDLVTFRELNLNGPWPIRRQYDAIFCRNVAIYFDGETRERLWDRFCRQMKPEGVLYIGHSERVRGSAAGKCSLVGTTTYQLTAEEPGA